MAKRKYQLDAARQAPAAVDSWIDARPRGGRQRETPKTKTAAFYLPVELLDRARNAVVALSGPPELLTMSRLVVSALERELARLEKKHRDGRPFPARRQEPRTGRPLVNG